MAGLYLHIPYCRQPCSHCDYFFMLTEGLHSRFVVALCAELEHYGQVYGTEETVETIYIGGGTPSVLHEDEFRRILETILVHFDTAGLREVTVEANPGDLGLDDLRGLIALGVNRLSIGVQSFFDDDLAFLNRPHTAAQSLETIELARRAGFENLSIDLLFGLPEQPEEYWGATLQKASDLAIPHLSVYGLTVEPNTPLYERVTAGEVAPLPASERAMRYQLMTAYLFQHGYEQYELSSFARPRFRSEHNELYWNHQNYIGFGPSAHSFWWTAGLRRPASRWVNVRNLNRYQALLAQHQLPLDARSQLSLDTLANEFIMLRLRTADGLDLERLEQTYGTDLLFERVDELAHLEAEGFIEPIRKNRVRLTDQGKLSHEAVIRKLLIEP